mgnify:CR=1 FL=1
MSDTGRAYEEDQQALEKELDGEVNVTAPQPFPEVHPEVYKDVEPILFRGFLTQTAEINGVPFVFKSINHHEYQMISLVTGGDFNRRPSQIKDYYDLFLTYGVLMVDGQNILLNREKWVADLRSFFGELPTNARQKVIWHLSEINRRAYRAVILTEVFSYESMSRLKWAQLQGSDLTSTSVTGIQGTETLGLNWAQLTWRALNYYEDMKYQSESDWENAKFVASSMAGKGMNKIHAHDRTRREKERDEQITRKDKLLRHVLLGDPMEGSKKVAGAPMQVASTVAELADQLEKDLRGEKDWHDQVVEEHERRVQQGYTEKAEQLRLVAERHREESGGKQTFRGTELRGLTPQDVQERLLRNRQVRAQRAASQIVYPELYDEKYDEFMEKWNLPRAAVVKPTDRDPSSAVPLPPARTPGTPWRGK